jgi:hypothetical protein
LFLGLKPGVLMELFCGLPYSLKSDAEMIGTGSHHLGHEMDS